MRKREYAILEVLPTPVFFKDFDGYFQYCNKTFYDFLGASETDIVGKKADEIGLVSVAERFGKADEALLAGEGVQVYEAKVANAKGEVRDLQIMKDLVYCDEDEELIGIAGVVVDVTERNLLAEELRKDALLKKTVLDIDRRITRKEGRDEVVGWILEKCLEVIEHAEIGSILILSDDGYLEIPTSVGYHEKNIEQFRLKIEDSFAYKKAGGIPDRTIVIDDVNLMHDVKFPESLIIDGGSVKTSLVSPLIINDEFYGFINIDSKKKHAFGNEDIKIMEYMRIQIQIALTNVEGHKARLMLMRTDYVTGIFNRRYFEELAGKGVAFSSDTDKKASLAMMDIDGMKFINDTYGHVAGDFVLKSFAQEIMSSIRGCDVMGRYGGDEFAVLFPGSEKDIIEQKLENIRSRMKTNPVKYEDNIIPLEFSYGVAEYPLDGISYCELIKTADDTMYEDKNKRKNEN